MLSSPPRLCHGMSELRCPVLDKTSRRSIWGRALALPPGIPIDGKTVFTSDHALKLEWLPNWIAIIGSGYIGLEFSDVYTALGTEVTFIEVGAEGGGSSRGEETDGELVVGGINTIGQDNILAFTC